MTFVLYADNASASGLQASDVPGLGGTHNGTRLAYDVDQPASSVTITMSDNFSGASTGYRDYITNLSYLSGWTPLGSDSVPVEINITTANMNVTDIIVILMRLNSSGVIQGSFASTTVATSGATTGVKVLAVDAGMTNLGTFGASDLLLIRQRFNIPGSTMGGTIGITTGATNSEITTPFTAIAKSNPPKIPHRYRNGLIMRGRR